MFRIGDFSRIARVSARLLRFYDELGLFSPAHSDAQTGYRHYTVAQLPELNRILVLKELGFELEAIRQIVRAGVTNDELRRMLLLRRGDAAQALADEAARLQRIESRIAQLDAEDGNAFDDVLVRSEPACPHFVSLRRTVPSFAQARALIAELRSLARPWLRAARGGRLVGIVHSPQFEQDEIDVEFGYAVAEAPGSLAPPLGLRELEALPRAAVCVRVGLPEDAHRMTARIGHYLAAHGDRLDGPSREVFLQPPNLERMEEAVVEMQFPIASLQP